MTGRRAAAALPVALALLPGSCTGGSEAEEPETGSPEASAPDARAPVGDDPAGRGESAARGDSVAPGVPTYPLRLINPRAYPVLVYASAGAGEVLLDTVGARDSSELDVRLLSDVLQLRAVDLEENELGTGYLALVGPEGDPVPELRWELPPPP